MLIDLADFALQDNQKTLMVAISQLWYNGSYTIAAKPIKTLESHYTMIQFLIIRLIFKWKVTLNFILRIYVVGNFFLR